MMIYWVSIQTWVTGNKIWIYLFWINKFFTKQHFVYFQQSIIKCHKCHKMSWFNINIFYESTPSRYFIEIHAHLTFSNAFISFFKFLPSDYIKQNWKYMHCYHDDDDNDDDKLHLSSIHYYLSLTILVW